MLKKTVKSKLQVNTKEKAILIATLERFAVACNQILETANETGKRRAYDLHHQCYYKIKEHTGLTSNYVVRAIARVAQSFGKKRPPTKFYPTSLDLDKDLFYFIPFNETISIATVEGRLNLKLQLGNFQRHLLQGQTPKAATLSFDSRKKAFYINFVIDVATPEPEGLDTLGVDLGINRIATTSDGERTSGRKINRIRERFQRTRSSLQSKCTKNAKRVLKRLRGRQARFTKDVNHNLSRKIVNKAKHTHSAIVMEDLKGIRDRSSKKGKRLRKLLGNWSFYQLRMFVEYKAKEAGVEIRFVNPAYTSKTCSNCFALGSRRKHKFTCSSCGYHNDADVNASLCIAALGAQVNCPEVAALRERQAVCFS
jgi:putative transposase